MRKFLTTLLLIPVLLFGSLSGCALITEQLDSVESMSIEKFEALEFRAFTVAKIGGRKVAEKLEEVEVAYLDATVRTLLSNSNIERAELLSRLMDREEYQDTLALAISGALDAIEVIVGKPLVLESLELTNRQHALVKAMLEGFLLGLSGTEMTHIVGTDES